AGERGRVNAKPLGPHQGLARKLEQDPLISRSVRHAATSSEAPPRGRHLLLLQSRLRAHLGREVVLALLEPLADLVAGEPANLAVLADLGDELAKEGSNVLLPI